MKARTIFLLAVLALVPAPALAGDANESSENLFYPVPAATEVALPQSAVTETEALALPEPELEAAAPANGCRKKYDETVYLTN